MATVINVNQNPLNKDNYIVFKGNSDVFPIVSVGAMSYIVGTKSIDYTGGSGHILIGKYTSIATDVTIQIGSNHILNQVANYPIDAILLNPDSNTLNLGRAKYNRNQMIIGNDVWIGSGVKFIGAHYIGNGAIVSAESVVTKDVPPYAIVGGNPAKIIRYRFTSDIIKKMQAIKWWNWNYDTIVNRYHLMHDVERFVEEFYSDDLIKENNDIYIKQLKQLHEDGFKLIFFRPDFSSNKPVYINVIKAFCNNYSEKDDKVLILHIKNDEELLLIENICINYQNTNILTIKSKEDFLSSFIQKVNYFITTREHISSKYVDYCELYGVKVLSGLEFNIFENII